jgi:hypothetical protein
MVIQTNFQLTHETILPNNLYIVRGARYRGFPVCSRQVTDVEGHPGTRLSQTTCHIYYKENDGDGFQEIFPTSAAGQVSQRPRQIHLSVKLSSSGILLQYLIRKPSAGLYQIFPEGITASRHFAKPGEWHSLVG